MIRGALWIAKQSRFVVVTVTSIHKAYAHERNARTPPVLNGHGFFPVAERIAFICFFFLSFLFLPVCWAIWKFKRGFVDCAEGGRVASDCALNACEHVFNAIINVSNLFYTFTGTFNFALYWLELRASWALAWARVYEKKGYVVVVFVIIECWTNLFFSVFFSVSLSLSIFAGRSKYYSLWIGQTIAGCLTMNSHIMSHQRRLVWQTLIRIKVIGIRFTCIYKHLWTYLKCKHEQRQRCRRDATARWSNSDKHLKHQRSNVIFKHTNTFAEP